MSIKNNVNRPQIQQSKPAVEAKKTEAPSVAKSAVATAKAGASAAAPKSDFFSGIKKNVFDAIKQAGPGIKDLGKKLIQDPGVKTALGSKDPSKVIDAARDFAKSKISEKLANTEFKLPSGEKSWDKGKNLPEGLNSKGFVEKGLQGPGELGINPTKSGTKEITLNDGQKGAVDKGFGQLGKVQEGFKKAGELGKLAEKLGINLPKYEKSGEVGTSKTLASSADGNHKVTADAKASGSVTADITGVKAQGQASVGVTASSQGAVSGSNKYGEASAGYQAQATAGAKASGSASIGADGVKLQGELEVGVKASVSGQAKVESKPIGGVPGLTVGAEVKGNAEVGASAYAKGEAAISAGPPPVAIAQGKAGVFAGARASAEATVSAGPIGATGKAEAWAGIGAEVSGTAGYKDGKLTLGFQAGAALGIGGKLGFEVNIDVKKAQQIAEHVIDKVADGAKAVAKAADADGDGKLTINDAKVGAEKVGSAIANGAKAVGNAVADGAKAVGNAVADGAKAVANAAGNALDKVGQGISNAGAAVSNFAKKLKFW